MMGIRSSFRDYEAWLRQQLGAAFVSKDLDKKHRTMRTDLFSFLRGSCWRWAETAPVLLPGLTAAPAIGAVVDAHIGNFGLWRDAEGRLVWGVNDYDEAAIAPWPFDLVRLAASALIAAGAGRRSAKEVAEAVIEGYRDGLAHPRPVVLEQDRLWLRDLFAATKEDRAKFWDELKAAGKRRTPPPDRFAHALAAALPEPGLDARIAPRQAGVGSLGRMRLVALVERNRGGPLAREAKAVVPSCWDRSAAPGALYALASGRYRAPDPWLRLQGEVVVRRLAPNSRKIELSHEQSRVRRRLLRAMASDIAAVHAADGGRCAAVRADLERRGSGWLREAAVATAEATERDWRAYRSR